MIILLSNDDGANAPALPLTVEALATLSDVYVCVPEQDFSSGAHALSPRKPLTLGKITIPYAKGAWKFSGTPADCVKFAFAKLLKEKPDLVVGGINPSPNLATEVIYSGTVSVALEGAMHGVPSIAMSQNSRQCDTKEAAKCLLDVIKRWKKAGFEPHTALSVNYPELPFTSTKGYIFARQGWRWYNDCFDQKQDSLGRLYYQLHGKNLTDGNDRDTDLYYISQGYIPITPLTWDMTDYQLMARMSGMDIWKG